MALNAPPIEANRRASVQTWALGLVGAFAIFLAYARVVRGEFLWDDDAHIYANPTIIGPLGLKEIWTSGKANYFPLTMTSFWALHALFGLSTVPYHVATILFHIGGALLLWRVLARLAVPGAWLGAMLWALHPVQVESVAWICELKNTQSGFFYLLAIYFFVRWLPREVAPKLSRDYLLALIAAVLAILSKSSTVMLPVVLGLVGWWMGRRDWRDLRWLVPFLAVSAIASGWTIWEQKVNSMASGPDWSYGLAARLTIAGKVPWFYLGKLLWPHPLIFIYPRWPVTDLGLADWFPLVATVLAVIALWGLRDFAGFLRFRRLGGARTITLGGMAGRALFLAFMVFGVSLFPVLGLFDVFFFKYSFVGDHFQYLASMGPLALVGAGVAVWAGHCERAPNQFRIAASVVLLGALLALTTKQTGIYLNRMALWRDSVERNPRAWIARMNLGSEYMQAGRPELAIPHFAAALQLRPGDALAETNWGSSLVQLGKFAEAIQHLENAVRLMPTLADAYNSLAHAYAAVGRTPDAIAQWETALRLKPDFELALLGLCEALRRSGRVDEAHQRLTTAVREHPRSPAYPLALGGLLKTAGRHDEAIAAYRAALQLNPGDVAALAALTDLFTQKGQYPQAIECGAVAIRLQPGSAEAQIRLANALLLSGHAADALPHYERALQLRPDDLDARANMAGALYHLGRVAEALPLYATVAQAQPRSAAARNNLGSALMQSGRLGEAMQQFREALQLEPNHLDARLNLALALEAAGRKTEAIAQYEEVLRRRPDEAAAQAKLKQLRGP